MASVVNSLSRAAEAATGSSSSSSSSATSTSTPPVTEDMFLQLLVAQLENQDPTDPTDSTTFVTQLAQFQTMEQSLSQGQDISSILADVNQIVAAMNATTSSPGSSTPTS